MSELIKDDSEIESMKKSDIIRKAAENAGIEVVDLKNVDIEKIELSGYPINATKSDIVKQAAEKSGVEVVEIPFDTLEKIDLKGLPKQAGRSKNKMY